MKTMVEISKEDFIKKFAEPMVEKMKGNIAPELAERCMTNVSIKGKTGKAIDFKSIIIEVDIPDAV